MSATLNLTHDPRARSWLASAHDGTDFVLHRDRLTTPLIRRGWTRDAAGTWSYDPSHPDANTQGFVEYPNVDVNTELVDLTVDVTSGGRPVSGASVACTIPSTTASTSPKAIVLSAQPRCMKVRFLSQNWL